MVREPGKGKSQHYNSRVAATNNKDIGIDIVYAIQTTPGRMKKKFIFWLHIKVLKLGAQNPNPPLQFTGAILGWEKNNSRTAQSVR
jgi:hypothetical protein